MHFILTRTVGTLHKAHSQFSYHFLIHACSTNTLLPEERGGTERDSGYALSCLSLSFSVIMCSTSGWLMRGSNMSGKGYSRLPWSLLLLGVPEPSVGTEARSRSNGQCGLLGQLALHLFRGRWSMLSLCSRWVLLNSHTSRVHGNLVLLGHPILIPYVNRATGLCGLTICSQYAPLSYPTSLKSTSSKTQLLGISRQWKQSIKQSTWPFWGQSPWTCTCPGSWPCPYMSVSLVPVSRSRFRVVMHVVSFNLMWQKWQNKFTFKPAIYSASLDSFSLSLHKGMLHDVCQLCSFYCCFLVWLNNFSCVDLFFYSGGVNFSVNFLFYNLCPFIY